MRVPELENLVELPESMRYVWLFFIELHNSRSSSGFGINPISYTEIKAYFDLNRIIPSDWEISLIKRMDNEAMKIHAEEAEKQQKKSQSKSKSK